MQEFCTSVNFLNVACDLGDSIHVASVSFEYFRGSDGMVLSFPVSHVEDSVLRRFVVYSDFFGSERMNCDYFRL
jgi:hypothetical protein